MIKSEYLNEFTIKGKKQEIIRFLEDLIGTSPCTIHDIPCTSNQTEDEILKNIKRLEVILPKVVTYSRILPLSPEQILGKKPSFYGDKNEYDIQFPKYQIESFITSIYFSKKPTNEVTLHFSAFTTLGKLFLKVASIKYNLTFIYQSQNKEKKYYYQSYFINGNESNITTADNELVFYCALNGWQITPLFSSFCMNFLFFVMQEECLSQKSTLQSLFKVIKDTSFEEFFYDFISCTDTLLDLQSNQLAVLQCVIDSMYKEKERRINEK